MEKNSSQKDAAEGAADPPESASKQPPSANPNARKKRCKRRPKSPSAPKHPTSSFIFFAREMKSFVVAPSDGLAKGELMSILGSKWRGRKRRISDHF